MPQCEAAHKGRPDHLLNSLRVPEFRWRMSDQDLLWPSSSPARPRVLWPQRSKTITTALPVCNGSTNGRHDICSNSGAAVLALAFGVVQAARDDRAHPCHESQTPRGFTGWPCRHPHGSHQPDRCGADNRYPRLAHHACLRWPRRSRRRRPLCDRVLPALERQVDWWPRVHARAACRVRMEFGAERHGPGHLLALAVRTKGSCGRIRAYCAGVVRDVAGGHVRLMAVVGDRDDAHAGAYPALRILAHRYQFCPRLYAAHAHAADHHVLSLSALRNTERRHDADATRRRQSVRIEICLRLQPLFAAAVATFIHRAHLWPRAVARRCRSVPPA